ncbi:MULTISPECIES: ABC transporter substrate-binding protein [unclassified Clostridioides]|uniref:ABC transporter substrate-binding protein n=1 Tax=unclassified Clostridioides TaxID=2635829 RepID=UPI001D11D46D|nr:ABC transporter substrate-binding protein [Clostridioides sp. ZZV14-6150]MCC0661604.1 ABC transporter substrate-binding protein [Clostridioides sp. ZZV14-6154]MCC0668977.1 ABC transporter substrate-binding protein [Clostridioides sp. ZZV14-6153]MCC0718207.1 ABC transporter substrate-binding protein [Clostridioides sp. ZZV14-6105]MCC0721548.1 ABC transporter substrate-binding protein [Clostridioides sp. ZZV14-6104]MCC0728145.1 ABC transporter substrate-binding protein [Clostridioides sp. ZZV
MKFKSNVLKQFFLIVMVVFFVGGIVGCSKKDNNNEQVNSGEKLELKYASGFSVENLEDGIKKVVDGDNRELILIPKKIKIPEKYKNANIVRTPVDNVLIASTTQACSLRTIGELDSIKAVTTEEQYWTIKEIKNLMKDGKIHYVGSNLAPDYEKIVDLNPDLTIVSSGLSEADTKFIDKLEELGLNYVVDNEYKEQNPFGRMEWTSLIAAFYDKEDIATSELDKTVQKIEEVSKKIKNKSKPKVVWASVYEGNAYIAPKNSYVDNMINMAGGINACASIDSNEGRVSIEQLHEVAKDADIFVYSSSSDYAPNLESIKSSAPVLSDLDVVKKGNLWVFAPDYYQSVDRTDELIVDLVEMFHPGTTGEKIKHYVNYDK